MNQIVKGVLAGMFCCALGAAASSQPAGYPPTPPDCSQSINETQVYRNLAIEAMDRTVAANAQIKVLNEKIAALQAEKAKDVAKPGAKPDHPIPGDKPPDKKP